MTIKAVTLDAAGTLIKTRRPVGQIYCDIAARHGASLDPAALGRGFAATFSTMPPMAFAELRGQAVAAEILDELERDWWRRLVREVTDHAGGVRAFEPFFTALYDYFATAEAWSLYPEVDAFLTAIAASNLQVAVISNFDSRLLAVLEGLGVGDRVGPIIFSTGAGSAKPDAGIFEDTVAELGRDPSECLHLGDNADADYAGAREAGMRALLLQRSPGIRLNAHEIRTLTEALPRLSSTTNSLGTR